MSEGCGVRSKISSGEKREAENALGGTANGRRQMKGHLGREGLPPPPALGGHIRHRDLLVLTQRYKCNSHLYTFLMTLNTISIHCYSASSIKFIFNHIFILSRSTGELPET